MSINLVVIAGNLTRDPEYKATASGMGVLEFGVAVNDRRKNTRTGEWEDVPNFVDVTMFGARADSLSAILAKGMRVTVVGKLRFEQWQAKEGTRRSKLSVVADELELPPRSAKQEPAAYAGRYDAPSQAMAEDDIPF